VEAEEKEEVKKMADVAALKKLSKDDKVTRSAAAQPLLLQCAACRAARCLACERGGLRHRRGVARAGAPLRAAAHRAVRPVLSVDAAPCAQVERLDSLLQKSVAYSEFLANKIKKEGDEGTVAVNDGAVLGTGLSQPKLIQGTMRPYQLVGVHWLVGLYENGLNGILGDEMGLGKTVQSIAMLAHLVEQKVSGAFMVVGPLST
jgi:SNF2 family DNA or RNA helicase